MVTIRVPITEQRDASYDILIGRGLLSQLPLLLGQACPAAAYAIITDAHVGKLYGEAVLAEVAETGCQAELLTFPAGERSKNRETWAHLCDRMLAHHFGRDAAIIALGGGVVGDIAGFVSATYLRGIPLVQMPTTLLAMIDSSIGGKTGVDVPAGKNLVGAFLQPRLVIADLNVLVTLAPPQLAAGLAEAIKHGAIADAEYFTFLEREHETIRAKVPEQLERLVARSIEIKAQVVSQDEREAGVRAVLNFGHTIAHAIEAVSKFEVAHGEAVGIGLSLESRLGEALEITRRGTAERIAGLLRQFGLRTERPDGFTVDALIEVMQQDKKRRKGELRFSFIEKVGVAAGNEHDGWTMMAPEGVVREVLG